MNDRCLTLRNIPIRLIIKTLCLVGFLVSSEQLAAQTTFRDCTGCPEMVLLPAGDVLMNWDQIHYGKKDVTLVPNRFAVAAIAVSRFEITAFEWAKCLSAGACENLPDNNRHSSHLHPATNMTWFQASEFVSWLSKVSGKKYRLLSEIEWEYAARGGNESEQFWGNDLVEAACVYTNFADVSYKARLNNKTIAKRYAECDDGFIYTAPVGSFKPNGFGLYDTSGNVWEWTQDCWLRGKYLTNRAADGSNEADCDKAAIRGGSYLLGLAAVRPPMRASRFRIFYNIDVGFRVARDP